MSSPSSSGATPLHLGLVLAAGILAFAVSAEIARAQCCPPLPVSRASWETNSGWQSMPPWIGATEDGWVHAVFRSSWVAQVYTSSDRGVSFGFPDTLVTEGSVTDGFAIAADGTFLAAYQQLGELRFRRSTDHAATWTPPISLAAMDAGATFPMPPRVQFALASSGLTALLAITSDGVDREHVVLVSPDFGASWSAPVFLRSSGGWLARVAVSATTVVVASEEGGSLVVRRSVDAGQAWSAPVRVGSQPLAERWHEIVSTGPGEFQVVHAVTTATAVSDIRVAVSLDDGATWDPANESVIGSSDFLVSEPPLALATPSGGLVVAGWKDVPLSPGVASNFSTDAGLPGTWLAAPAFFATAGRAQHDYRMAVLPDDTALIVHDDYRHDATAACPPGRECESIYMSRACPGSGAWEEFRLDEDAAPNPTHSENPAIATTSDGRLHVLWMNLPDAALGVAQLRSMAVVPTVEAPATLTLTPAPDCLSATQELSLDSGLLAACPSVSIQWFRDDVAIAGATAPTLLLDPADIDGASAWHATFSCGAGCESRTLDVIPEPFNPGAAPTMLRTDLPAAGCIPERTLLEAVPLPVAECALPAYQWFMDGGAIAGARSTTLVVSGRDFPSGSHSFHCEARCTPARACGGTVWPSELVTVVPMSVPPVANVGAALRITDHGDPHAADITAVMSWTLDEGQPRVDEHHHVLRGEQPGSLSIISSFEPLMALGVVESTPASPQVRHVHFYSVLAANACEDVSLD